MHGQTYYKNLIINWNLSEKFGLSISTIQCGLCKQLIESAAVKLHADMFLTCMNGHLVGTNIDPKIAKEQLVISSSDNDPVLMQEYESLRKQIEMGQKCTADLQIWELKNIFLGYGHYASKQEYNAKIYDLVSQFKDEFSTLEK